MANALALNVVASTLIGLVLGQFDIIARWPIAVFLAIASMGLFVLFAITCHRLVLLGDSSVPKYGLVAWTARESRFFGWVLMLIAIYMVSVLFVGGLSVIFSKMAHWNVLAIIELVVGIVSVGYVCARLSLLLPATAIGESRGIAWAWELSRGQGIRILLVTSAMPIFMMVVGGRLNEHSGIISDLCRSLLHSFSAAFDVVALSLVFRFLVTRNQSQDASEVTA